MTNDIAAAALTRRESARTCSGRFGTHPATEAGLELDDAAPAGPRTVSLPDPRDEQALREFVTVEVARHRESFHEGDIAVRFEGRGILDDLKCQPAGAQLSQTELEVIFERHQFLDPEDYEYERPGLWGRLLGRPSKVRPRPDVQPTWP